MYYIELNARVTVQQPTNRVKIYLTDISKTCQNHFIHVTCEYHFCFPNQACKAYSAWNVENLLFITTPTPPPHFFAIGSKFSPGYTRLNLGFPERNDILNYLLILSKLCIWECRRSNCSLYFNLFLFKLEVKKETERPIAVKNGKNEKTRPFQTLRSARMARYGF